MGFSREVLSTCLYHVLRVSIRVSPSFGQKDLHSSVGTTRFGREVARFFFLGKDIDWDEGAVARKTERTSINALR